MNVKNHVPRLIFALSFICVSACSRDIEETENTVGSEIYIQNLIGEEMYSSVSSQNFIFNTGDTPPIIESIFRANTLQVQFSNIENDPALNRYISPNQFTFFNQDNESLILDFSMSSEVIGATVIDDANIIGSGDKFTVFFEVPIQSNGYAHKYFQAVSGRLTTEGIEDFQMAFFMKERDSNAPDNEAFLNNTGRVFVETDGLAENNFLDLN